MRIGLITFHNGSNYGAALQTYALQEALKESGNQIEIINYQNQFIMKGLSLIRFETSLRGLYYSLVDVANIKTNSKKIQMFHTFFKRYALTAPLSKNELKDIDLNYEMIVSGSDQIWNPLLNRGFDDIYFGAICNAKRKMSYGSSIGNYNFENELLNTQLKTLLSSYERISVRENASKLVSHTGIKAVEVCDPTILLNNEKWRDKLGLAIRQDQYLLIYCLSDAERVISYSLKLAKERGLKVYYIGRPVKWHPQIRLFCDIGPREFVELFFNASYIVTNSFHGTAFSVNFSKQFVSLKHPKSPERAVSFLEKLLLSNRLITNEDIIGDMTDIELNEAAKRLQIMREEGYSFLNIGKVYNET